MRRRSIAIMLFLGLTSLASFGLCPPSKRFEAGHGRRFELLQAIDARQAERVESILRTGLKPNFSIREYTPLGLAVEKCDLQIVNILLEHGADPNYASKYGDRPLPGAAWVGSVDIVRALLRAGADVKRGNRYEESPLHLAAFAGNDEVIKELVVFGADVNLRNRHGAPPIFSAAWGLRPSTVEVLLSLKADPCVKAKNGITIFDRLAKPFLDDEQKKMAIQNLLDKRCRQSTGDGG
jgi:ankyrin repeat protein